MPQRTEQQRKAMEVYFRELGNALNDAGYDMKAVLAQKEVDVPWSQDLVKAVLWRPIQLAMYDKASTTELDTDEVDPVYKVLDRHISSKFGVHVDWPCKEEQNEQI